MFKFIDKKIFLLSFILGLIFIYYTPADGSLIYVYPTPDNVKKIEYKDKINMCYEYIEELISCPRDKSEIKKIPTQN